MQPPYLALRSDRAILLSLYYRSSRLARRGNKPGTLPGWRPSFQGFAKGAMRKQSKQAIPHYVREAVERCAVETSSELNRFDSRFFEQFADAGNWQTLLALIETYCTERFDLMAERL